MLPGRARGQPDLPPQLDVPDRRASSESRRSVVHTSTDLEASRDARRSVAHTSTDRQGCCDARRYGTRGCHLHPVSPSASASSLPATLAGRRSPYSIRGWRNWFRRAGEKRGWVRVCLDAGPYCHRKIFNATTKPSPPHTPNTAIWGNTSTNPAPSLISTLSESLKAVRGSRRIAGCTTSGKRS